MSQTKHLMIDLETLSLRQDAAILSIGAVLFNIETGEIETDNLHIGIAMLDQPNYGHIDPDTVAWWLKQPNEAQQSITHLTRHGMLLADALEELRFFVENLTNPEHVRVWSNGATFDIVTLDNAYARHGKRSPWNFWNHRDVRTIVEMGRTLLDFDPKHDMPFEGIQHNALADAIHQAKYVSQIYSAIQDCVKARP
jgi:hypothetical protein